MPDSVTDVTDIDIYYRELPVDEWAKAHALLSYAYPGKPMELNPDLQRIVVAEDKTGQVLAAAIVSVAYHVNYVAPAAVDIRLDVLQSVSESLIPNETLYYTMCSDGPESEIFTDELNMEPCPGVVTYVKRSVQ
jgi:hypothetical protein